MKVKYKTRTKNRLTTENGQESGTSLDAMIAQWNEELDADTVTNLTDEEQVAVRTLFANTIFFGDSMTQAIGEYGFLDMTNIVYQRSATIDVLITKDTRGGGDAALKQVGNFYWIKTDCNSLH